MTASPGGRSARRSWMATGCAVALGAGVLMSAPAQGPTEPVWDAQVFCVDPLYWEGSVDPHCAFPEQASLNAARPWDFGVAFSGGGTRSASATIGQIRGLVRNGWFDRTRYLSAVSGSSWAVVPLTFSIRPLNALLGSSSTPGCSTADFEDAPCGLLALAVQESRVLGHGLKDVLGGSVADRLSPRDRNSGEGVTESRKAVAAVMRSLGIGGGAKDTYADILGKIFLRDEVCPGCANRAFSSSFVGTTASRVRSRMPTVPAVSGRPYFIAEGSVIDRSGSYEFPRLLPFEMTADYAGVRQRFAPFLGGRYLTAWAYGMPLGPREADGSVLALGAQGSAFTMQQVLGISGAAPLLHIILGNSSLQKAAAYFPELDHWSARDAQADIRHTKVSHGDGGFNDYLGVMPLLARQVHNILVFANASGPYNTSGDIEALFRPLGVPDGNGDKTRNVVFDEEHYADVLAQLNETGQTGTAMACGIDWEVKPNRHFNIQGYRDVNICFVYNQRIDSFWRRLPESVRGNPQYKRFPMYRTFFENDVRNMAVIDLTVGQVNLLGLHGEWSITNPIAKAALENTFAILRGATPVN